MAEYNNEQLRPFRFSTQVVLPLVYDDALSYLEVLRKTVDKLNEVIDWANNYRDDLKSYVDQKTLENLQELQAELSSYKTEVNGALDDMQFQLDMISNDLNQKIADFSNQTTQQINDFKNQTTQQLYEQDQKVSAQLAANEAAVKAEIFRLTAQVSAQLALVWQEIKTEREFNKAYTDMKIQQLIAELPKYYPVPVICPANNKLMPLQSCLTLMYDKLRVWSLTCNGYDDLGLTCDQYDNLFISCDEYDLEGKLYLNKFFYIHHVFSGNTGELVRIKDAIFELWQLHRYDGLTAEEYDNLNLTAAEYDAKEETAYNYDWNAWVDIAGNPSRNTSGGTGETIPWGNITGKPALVEQDDVLTKTELEDIVNGVFG